LEKAAAEQDKAKRTALYEKGDALLCQEAAPIAPTYQSTQNLMVKPWVHGFETDAMDLQFFKSVHIGE
jgi:ABC-type transport system substrate-binding protein